jgi:hypothetical protein
MTDSPATPLLSLDCCLAELRDASRDWSPPAAVDAAIAAAASRAMRTRRAAPRWIAWPLALAATITVVSFVVGTWPQQAPVGPAPTVSDEVRHAFMPVVPVAEIERASDALVVPARMPRMSLAQFGLPVDPARADDAIDTELLVRRDGALLAYRFVN